MKKLLCLLFACVLITPCTVIAEQSVSIIGQWETEILGRNYLLEFLDNGTLRCYEEETSQSDSDGPKYKTEPCDVMTYAISGNDLSVNLQMIVYPDGNSISVWRRYDGNYVASLNRYNAKASTGAVEMPNADYPGSLSFSGKAPNSSFAGYSSEVPGFTVTLNADLSGYIMERYMEEVNKIDIQWSCNGSVLILSGRRDKYTVSFSNGKGIYDDFYGERISVTLPKNADQFFLGALGYVPDGLIGQPQPTSAPTAQPQPTEQPYDQLLHDAQEADLAKQKTEGPQPARIKWEGTIWSVLYYDFIMNGGYKHSKKDFYPDAQYSTGPSFCLYDMDRDGIPELIAFNGGDYSAMEETYLFAVRNGEIVCLGTVGGQINLIEYLDNDRYPGLFDEYGRMGFYVIYYHSLDEEGRLSRETVMEIEQNANYEYEFNFKTEDQALIDLIMSGIRAHEPSEFTPDRSMDPLHIHGYTPKEIEAMGWDAFISACPVEEYGEAEMNLSADEEPPADEALENPLIMPADGEQIDLWSSDAFVMEWKSVAGATKYDVEIKCAWKAKGGKNKTKTIYRGSFDAATNKEDSTIFQSVPIEELDLEGVPRTKDLNAWVILTIYR